MESNTYRPLTEAGEKRIHSAALDALETIGLGDVPESGKESMLKAAQTRRQPRKGGRQVVRRHQEKKSLLRKRQ